MRNLIPILLAVVVLSSGCDPDGYSCNSEGCYAENNAQYLTLEDCLSVCDEITPLPAVFNSCGDDIGHEGYDYSTVQIGDQCWFAENCRYLPSVSPSSADSDTSPFYFVYGYEGYDVEIAKATDSYETYGVLYNWPAVMTEGICPSGWHIPSDGEFTELTDFLGGESIAGGKMKEAGYDHWDSPNEGATNSSGWTGLPGGYYDGIFYFSGRIGFWWSASEFATEAGSYSWTHTLYNASELVDRAVSGRDNGLSARCVRD
jgi:uncharacterized protein (TIGR02145 family)